MIRRPPRSTRTDTSFPTRRSSDLSGSFNIAAYRGSYRNIQQNVNVGTNLDGDNDPSNDPAGQTIIANGGTARIQGEGSLRSEEHTSELQSLMRISYAVFCLKKKN